MNAIKKLFFIFLVIICFTSCKKEAKFVFEEEKGVVALYMSGTLNDTLSFYQVVGDNNFASSSLNKANTMGVSLEVGQSNLYSSINPYNIDTGGISVGIVMSATADTIPFHQLIHPSNTYSFLSTQSLDLTGITIIMRHKYGDYTSQRVNNQDAQFQVGRIEDFHANVFCQKKVDIEFSCKLKNRYSNNDTSIQTLQVVGSFLFQDDDIVAFDCNAETSK